MSTYKSAETAENLYHEDKKNTKNFFRHRWTLLSQPACPLLNEDKRLIEILKNKIKEMISTIQGKASYQSLLPIDYGKVL